MRKDRHLVIQLRRQGKSYNEISRNLKIPKSTIHLWLKGNEWSAEIKKDLIKKAQVLASPKLRLMALAQQKKWADWHDQSKQDAISKFPKLQNDLLFMAGLMLYWGEGDKILENGQVRLTNSDPELIKIYYSFLCIAIGLPKEKIYVKLILYPDLKDMELKKYWSQILKIPLEQFKNSSVIIGKHPTKRLSYGICSVEVYSRSLKEKIFTWLRLYQEYFNKINYT